MNLPIADKAVAIFFKCFGLDRLYAAGYKALMSTIMVAIYPIICYAVLKRRPKLTNGSSFQNGDRRRSIFVTCFLAVTSCLICMLPFLVGNLTYPHYPSKGLETFSFSKLSCKSNFSLFQGSTRKMLSQRSLESLGCRKKRSRINHTGYKIRQAKSSLFDKEDYCKEFYLELDILRPKSLCCAKWSFPWSHYKIEEQRFT